MIKQRPLALDDAQMAQLLGAAQLVPVNSRDIFLRSVANRVAEIRDPSNADISNAITFVLNARGIATSTFACDAAPKETTHAKRR